MIKKFRHLLYSSLLLAGLASCSDKPDAETDNDPTPAPVGEVNPHTKPEGESIAFVGAEGFGKATTGGRGGRVFIVSNLNDSGPGSLREAVSANMPRMVVFAVSGTIDLRSNLDIRNGNLTIAGQSAPGDGICISGRSVRLIADNIIIRYMRFRLGDVQQVEADALEGQNRKNIMIDHCSISWATDECSSFYDNENFTMQWSIISESLNESLHDKGAHGYGGIWGGKGASFHHNLLAHHASRNPRFNGARYHKQPALEIVDFRNNVIYNWINSSLAGEEGNHNMVNNYYKFGPATPAARRNRIVEPTQPFGKFYVTGNHVFGNATTTSNNWNGGVQNVNASQVPLVQSTQPFPVIPVPVKTAEAAFEDVLAKAGASLRRDAVDARVVEEVRTGTAPHGKNGNGIIDSQADVGGWPTLASLPAPLDTDRDGIPDEWEIKNNMNPNNAADAAYYKKGTPFTYLEIYLDSLVNPSE